MRVTGASSALLLAALASPVAGQSQQGNAVSSSRRVVSATAVDKAPVVDGKLDDDAWRGISREVAAGYFNWAQTQTRSFIVKYTRQIGGTP